MRGVVAINSDIDKGMDFARVARLLGREFDPGDLENMAGLVPGRIVDATKAARQMKGAIIAGRMDGNGWGAELAPYTVVANAFMESLRSTGVFFRVVDSMLKVPLRSQLSALTASASGYVLGEGSARRISRLSLENEYIDPFRATAFVIVTNELLKLGDLADPIISFELKGAVTTTTDAQFLTILDAGATTSASTGNTVARVQEDLKTALAALDLGTQSKLFFITNPDTVKMLATMTIDGGFAFSDVNPVTGGTLLKTPLIPCDSCPYGTFYAIDASGIAGNTEALLLERFHQATVQMDDSPDSPPTGSTVLISLFQEGLTCIQVSTWAGAKVVRSNCVYKLTGVDWGSANSP